MYRLTALIALAFVSACAEEAVEEDRIVTVNAIDTASVDPAASSPTEILEVYEDGDLVGTTRITADGRYHTTYLEGAQENGSSFRDDSGRLCFDPDGRDPSICWRLDSPGSDGSYRATSEEGYVVTIRPLKL